MRRRDANEKVPKPVRRPATAPAGLGTILALAGAGLAVAVVAGRRGGDVREPETGADIADDRARRRIGRGAAILGGSVLLDSAIEHFRGGFRNRAMYVAPLVACVSVASSIAPSRGRHGVIPRRLGHGVSLTTGLAGLLFHVYNLAKRPQPFSLQNLFYAAPVGAPGALALAGLLGLFSEAPARPEQGTAARVQRDRIRGRMLAGLTGLSLVAESAEVWLLHFRGAFHNPGMYLPVTLPPTAALLLLTRAVAPGARVVHLVRRALSVTSLLGFLGTLFHVYGVHRNMGGWRNWRQTVPAGPPTPAPISFTGLAMAGAAALDLMDAAASVHGKRP